MADITYCSFVACPLVDCERHLNSLRQEPFQRPVMVSIADFAPTCRDYIRSVVDEVSKNG